MEHIKINDLSVGDWVMYEGNHRKVALIDGVNGLVKFSLSPNFVGTGAIEPIPITSEILKANGWTWDGMYARLRINEHSHFEYYKHERSLRKWWKGIDEWENHAEVSEITFRCHCCAVHQLQHALRLAGITKEIEL